MLLSRFSNELKSDFKFLPLYTGLSLQNARFDLLKMSGYIVFLGYRRE